ncbi:hypothetical protein [Rhizorhabdus phycosphaerae]|uniref:hypothetical protein n=1 Tax=Rhizorhabdus phycosphaerae TaxID=2711156 RepID=UPI0013ED5ECF|nr:hypothetical protein [Rhizorhabdus phycosphaerae]
MTTDSLPSLPSFFIERLEYDIASLRVWLSVDGRVALKVTFEQPRAFRSFSESDYWHYLNDVGGRALVCSSDSGCGILMSETTPYLLDYREHAREQEHEETFSCVIVSPQECVEVICFEEPTILKF